MSRKTHEKKNVRARNRENTHVIRLIRFKSHYRPVLDRYCWGGGDRTRKEKKSGKRTLIWGLGERDQNQGSGKFIPSSIPGWFDIQDGYPKFRIHPTLLKEDLESGCSSYRISLPLSSPPNFWHRLLSRRDASFFSESLPEWIIQKIHADCA